jgi:hypothetical protein
MPTDNGSGMSPEARLVAKGAVVVGLCLAAIIGCSVAVAPRNGKTASPSSPSSADSIVESKSKASAVTVGGVTDASSSASDSEMASTMESSFNFTDGREYLQRLDASSRSLCLQGLANALEDENQDNSDAEIQVPRAPQTDQATGVTTMWFVVPKLGEAIKVTSAAEGTPWTGVVDNDDAKAAGINVPDATQYAGQKYGIDDTESLSKVLPADCAKDLYTAWDTWCKSEGITDTASAAIDPSTIRKDGSSYTFTVTLGGGSTFEETEYQGAWNSTTNAYGFSK